MTTTARRPSLLTAAALAWAALSACADELAGGTLEVRVFGEDFIEDQIPADAFADGWSVEFSTFLVAISDVAVGQSSNNDTPALTAPTTKVFDLTQDSGGRGHLLTSVQVPGGRYDNTTFTIAPADTGAITGNVSNDQVAAMVSAGASVLVEGRATRGQETKTFAWAFTSRTRYLACESTAKVDGGTHATQLTIHADHLFYDSLVAEEPALRFDLIANADTDQDGRVTQSELAAVDITAEADYGVGNRTDITTLGAFIEAQLHTLGHIDGEGHCETD